MENTNVSEIIAKVKSSSEFGGVMYTQEQVITLLEMVKCTQSQSELPSGVLDKMQSMLDDIQTHCDNLSVNVDDISFSVRHGNEIYVDGGDVEIENKYDLEESIVQLESYIQYLQDFNKHSEAE